MKTWQKVIFVAALIFFVSMSVTIALISISRPPYAFSEKTAIGDNEDLNGWVLTGFNGSISTKTLTIDFVRDKTGKGPDGTRPVVAVGAYAVNADEYVEELVIGPFVQHIEETSFYNLKKLQKVTVSPDNAFYQDLDGVLYSKDGKDLLLYPACYGQTPTDNKNDYTYPDTYTVPDGVARIGTFAFLKNEHIRDLALPESLREIGDMTFFGCSNLGKISYNAETDALEGTGFILPEGLETIGTDAFSKCGNIAPVLYLPASVQSVGHHAFFSCGGMKEIYLGAADEDALSLGEAWRPKNLKAGPLWKSPEPQFGKSRADAQALIETYRAERLQTGREEAQKNG